MHEIMRALFTFAALLSALCIALAAVVTWGYYFYFRPIWTDTDTLNRVESYLTNPSSPVEGLRFVALDCQRAFVQSHDTIDVAVQFFLMMSVIGVLGFGYLAINLYRFSKGATRAL
ncbi:MAG TPA: hypothetical protein VFC18_04655 [Burkholderiales bacterium]|nr:hypothetical protein [Burkholderiales bacterium]